MRDETSELIKKRILHILPPLVGLLLFGGALFVLHRELGHYRLVDIQHSFDDIPLQRIVFALVLTVAGYLIMSGYDILALDFINHPLAYRKVAPASFIGYAFSNNIGLSMLAGASVRYTLYAAWGLRPGEIGKVVFFCTLTLWLGFLSLGGIILLLSGATPAISWRLHWLKQFLPLAMAEVSHFLASLVGAGLLVLARGLQRRLDAAYVLTLLLFMAGIVFSFLKGGDYEEAGVLAIMLAALLPCRRYFYRKAALLSEPFTVGWIIAISLVFSATLWLIFFSYKHIEYSQTLWWQFAFNADAPRSLRAMVGAIMVVGFFFMVRLLRPQQPSDTCSETVGLARIENIVSRSSGTSANLGFLGDKKFLVNWNGDAFLMYRIKGRSWVVMGDPIGPEEEWPELIWRFKEMSDLHGGWPVFYEVSHEHLRYYIDIGFMLFKLGEEARVPLLNFSLQGHAARGLRYTKRRFEKEGWQFKVVPRTEVVELLPSLRVVSDDWLAAKHTREKGFSMGFFESDYLARFPIALVTKGEDIFAFANIWIGRPGGEISIDLMRYSAEAPQGIMDFLFLHLMLWGQEEQFQWFNLGMAPLAGMADHHLAPLWNRVGAFVFRHGEHFYNFNGLRRYKEKFQPIWEPRYLAAPGRVKLLPILSDIAALISGGIKGVIGK